MPRYRIRISIETGGRREVARANVLAPDWLLAIRAAVAGVTRQRPDATVRAIVAATPTHPKG